MDVVLPLAKEQVLLISIMFLNVGQLHDVHACDIHDVHIHACDIHIHACDIHDVHIHACDIHIHACDIHDVHIHACDIHDVHIHACDIHDVHIHACDIHDVHIHACDIHDVHIHACDIHNMRHTAVFRLGVKKFMMHVGTRDPKVCVCGGGGGGGKLVRTRLLRIFGQEGIYFCASMKQGIQAPEDFDFTMIRGTG